MPEFSQWSGAAMNTRQLLLVPAAARTEISAVYSPTILADIAPEPVLAAPAISDPLHLENQECFKKKKIHLPLFQLSHTTNPLEDIKNVIWCFTDTLRGG